jgi:Putative zinc-finger
MQSINCTEITEQLDAYHDGELAGTERAVIEQHLSGCPACIAKLREIDRVVHTLKNIPQPAIPIALATKLDNMLDDALAGKTPTNKSRQQNVLAFHPALAAPIAVAAVSLALFLAYRFMAPTQAPTVTASQPTTKTVQVAQMQTPENQAVTEPQPEAQTQIAEPAPIVVDQHSNKRTEKHKDTEVANAQHSASVNSHGSEQANAEKIAGAMKSSRQSTRQSSGQPVPAPVAAAETGDSELADLPVSTPTLNDTLGIATDEDGLYDIKM